jgi:hypothetical protein
MALDSDVQTGKLEVVGRLLANVRNGSEPDILEALRDVRFTLKSVHSLER